MSETLTDIEWTSYMNLCHIADHKGDFDSALQYAQKACLIKPMEPDGLFHVGIILTHMGKFHDAVEIYKKTVSMAPDKQIYKYNLAFALLSIKEFRDGFELYDLRLSVEERPNFGAGASQTKTQFLSRFPKLWDGKEYYKNLYIFAEQGIGDVIYFSRYLPFLIEDAAKINAKITFEAKRSIAPVIKTLFPQITVIPRDGEFFPAPKNYDAAISICSLGRLYWDREVKVPYFPEAKKPKNKKLKVGLAWAGFLNFPNDHLRSMRLSEFKRLPDGIDYYSFQMGVMQRTWPHEEKVNLLDYDFPFTADLTHEIFDFRDTARLLDEMDLIVSADTAIAHFAGAMGKECWLLNPCISDWRWCPNITEDNSEYSYLYPTVRIFTQKKYKDWSSVIEHIGEELNIRAIHGE